MYSSKINDFVAVVEALNDHELVPEDMHFAYSNSDGYIDNFNLGLLEYAVKRFQETIDLAYKRRAQI